MSDLKSWARFCQFQMGMRGLMVLILAAALVCGWLYRIKYQADTVAMIRETGSLVEYSPEIDPFLEGHSRNQTWKGKLISLLGPDTLGDVVTVDLRNFNDRMSQTLFDRIGRLPKITKLELKLDEPANFSKIFKINNINKIRSMSITGQMLSDSNIEEIKRINSIDDLWIGDWGKQITGDGVIHLAEMYNLRKLSFNCDAALDEGITVISRLTNLKELILSGTSLNDEHLSRLSLLTRLEHLNVEETAITDDGLSQISKLKKLKKLGLFNTKVTDEGLVHLGGLTQLEEIDLTSTSVTKEGVRQLDHLRHLREVHLSRSK